MTNPHTTEGTMSTETDDHVVITKTDNDTYDRLVALLLEEDHEPGNSPLDADDILKQIIAERDSLRAEVERHRQTLEALREGDNKPHASLARADLLIGTQEYENASLRADLTTARERVVELEQRVEIAIDRGLRDTKVLVEIRDCSKCDLCEDHHE